MADRILRYLFLPTALTLILTLTQSCGTSESNGNDEYFINDDNDDNEVEYEVTDNNGTLSVPDNPLADMTDVEPGLMTEDNPGLGFGDVAIPFIEQGGVKLVDVKINGSIGVDMIIDSGCSGTLISLAEAQYMAQKGVLTEADILGQQTAQIADGSITLNTVVRLRSIVIGNSIVCNDVTATVADNMNAPLLLGNDVLNRSGSYTIDNIHHLLIFHNVSEN